VRHKRQHLNGEPCWRCLSRQRLIRLLRKRRKGELKHARSKRKNKGRKKEKKKKKNQINNKKKNGKPGERMRTGQLLAPEPPAAARDLAGLSKYRVLDQSGSSWCRNP